MITRTPFEDLVVQAIMSLPEDVRKIVDAEVAVIVQDKEEPWQLRIAKKHRRKYLYGLYIGTNHHRVGLASGGRVVGARVFIFEENIVNSLDRWDGMTLKEVVFDVVTHEIKHHFGLRHK